MVKFHSDQFLNLGIFRAGSPIGRRSSRNNDHLDSSGVMFRSGSKLRVSQLPPADLVAVHRGAGRGNGEGGHVGEGLQETMFAVVAAQGWRTPAARPEGGATLPPKGAHTLDCRMSGYASTGLRPLRAKSTGRTKRDRPAGGSVPPFWPFLDREGGRVSLDKLSQEFFAIAAQHHVYCDLNRRARTEQARTEKQKRRKARTQRA